MEEKYIGHVNSETKEIQSLKVHLENVRYLAEKNCPLELFRYIAQVTALIHDMGKTRQEFQDYMNDILEHGEYAIRHQIDLICRGTACRGHEQIQINIFFDRNGNLCASWSAGLYRYGIRSRACRKAESKRNRL